MVQDLKIALEPWFEEYKNLCIQNELIQASWQPAIGDWMERVHRLDLSLIKKEERSLEMLAYKSDANGWWHVATSDGRTLLWNSQDEVARKTAKWVPRLDQLMMFDQKTVKQSHIYALELFVHHLKTNNLNHHETQDH